MEVAEAPLTYDRTDKASLYAKAGIADYWIANDINLKNDAFASLTIVFIFFIVDLSKLS